MGSHSKLFYFLVTWQITRMYTCGPATISPWTQETETLQTGNLCEENVVEYKWKDFQSKQEAVDFIDSAPLEKKDDINGTTVSDIGLYEVTDDKYEVVDDVIESSKDESDPLPDNVVEEEIK